MSTPDDPRKREGNERLGAQRMRVALLVLTVFGAPLVLMISYLWMRNAAFRPPFAAQPGGTLAGRVAIEAPEEAPAPDQSVQILLHPRDRAPEAFQVVRTDADGAFKIDVPPIDGCYVVVAGGGTWITERREVSLAGGEVPDLGFELRPGCEIVLSLARRDGRAIRGGEYQLLREGRSFGLPLPSDALTGTFPEARIERDGLRPGRWTLELHLDDGTEVTYELELEPGRHEIALEPY